MCVCRETLQNNRQRMLAGVLSERNLGFNLGFAYVMFLIHPNIYRCCNFFKMREKNETIRLPAPQRQALRI